MSNLIDDLRLAVRSLRRAPAFSITAIVTLALGIGANAAIFSVLNALLLKPLDYREPDQLVRILEANPARGWTGAGVTGPVFVGWREAARSLDGLAVYTGTNAAVTGFEEPFEATMGVAGEGLFDVLGIRPILGRGLTALDHQVGAPPVAILNRTLWVTRYGADSSVIGRTITINRETRPIVGVVDDRGELTGNFELWAPLPEVYRDLGHGNHLLTAVGRLRPGIAIEQVEAELRPATEAVMATVPESARGWVPVVAPLRDAVVGAAGTSVRLLLWAVALVLLIACVNVANLTLVRSHGRRREVAVRAALGADRGRIARGLMAESAVVAVAGGVGGLLLAFGAIRLLPSLAPAGFPRIAGIGIDWAVLGYTAAATIVAVLVFGALPAFRSARVDLQTVLRSESGGATRRGRGRDVMAVAEIALALVLTSGAGLLLSSLIRLQSLELGYDPTRVLALDLDLPAARYQEPTLRTQFLTQVEDLVRAVPGVISVGSTRALPLESGGPDTEFDIAGRPTTDPKAQGWAFYTPVSAGYHTTMRARLVSGRYLESQDDRPGAAPVVVVNETLAREYWPGQSPVGARIRFGPDRGAEIVGVIGDLRQRNLADPIRPAMFVPFSQLPQVQISMVVRTSGDPMSLIAAFRKAVWAVDPSLPIEQWSMFDLMREATGRPRFHAALFGLFAFLAVALAAIGVYGVISFGVSQQRREIGVRMALGASRRTILAMVAKQGLAIALLGVTIGGLGALAVGRVLTKLLFGIAPADPANLAVAVLGVGVVIVIGSLIPARRAAAQPPSVVLRGE